jgi:hypothetical protein
VVVFGKVKEEEDDPDWDIWEYQRDYHPLLALFQLGKGIGNWIAAFRRQNRMGLMCIAGTG